MPEFLNARSPQNVHQHFAIPIVGKHELGPLISETAPCLFGGFHALRLHGFGLKPCACFLSSFRKTRYMPRPAFSLLCVCFHEIPEAYLQVMQRSCLVMIGLEFLEGLAGGWCGMKHLQELNCSALHGTSTWASIPAFPANHQQKAGFSAKGIEP